MFSLCVHDEEMAWLLSLKLSRDVCVVSLCVRSTLSHVTVSFDGSSVDFAVPSKCKQPCVKCWVQQITCNNRSVRVQGLGLV